MPFPVKTLEDLRIRTKYILMERANLRLYCVIDDGVRECRGVTVVLRKGDTLDYSNDFSMTKPYLDRRLKRGDYDLTANFETAIKWLISSR